VGVLASACRGAVPTSSRRRQPCDRGRRLRPQSRLKAGLGAGHGVGVRREVVAAALIIGGPLWHAVHPADRHAPVHDAIDSACCPGRIVSDKDAAVAVYLVRTALVTS
jgi:hypothetical protein